MPASALEAMREFVASYDAGILGLLAIDYTDRIPDAAGLFPAGMVENSRRSDLLGNVTTENTLNFALYVRLGKSPGDDAIATTNAEWAMEFQRWVQYQSATGRAPAFGDVPRTERMIASNGAIYSASDEGTAIYAIQISVHYTRIFRRA